MPYRQVIRAKKLGGQFAGHARRHARRVAASATEPFRDQLSAEREFLDLYEFQVAVGERLDRMHEELIAIDDRHAGELELDRQLRDQREGWYSELRAALLMLKDILDGSFGPGAARAVFQEDPPNLPADPTALHQVGQRVTATLTDPGFALEPAQPGVTVDPVALAGGFAVPLEGLGTTLKRLHDSESETRHTQSRKDDHLERMGRYSGKVARFYEAFYDLAGHERLANRLRRSSHVQSAEGEPDPGSSPGSAATADGEPAATAGESAATASGETSEEAAS